MNLRPKTTVLACMYSLSWAYLSGLSKGIMSIYVQEIDLPLLKFEERYAGSNTSSVTIGTWQCKSHPQKT